MRIEFRMAWRETRSSWKRFLFMIGAIALGVGALTGIKGFSTALDEAMSRSARDLIASDIAVRMNSAPSDEESSVLRRLVDQGATMTRVTETLSMASAGGAAQPLLSTVKAVDPLHYPFYGTVQLAPARPLREALGDDTAIVSRDLLIRTGSAVGQELTLGSARFRISAILVNEPDRIASGVEFGPRILITRGGLDKSGLIQFGSRAAESFLYRLPPRGLSLETARSTLREGLQRRVRISDARNPNSSLSRGLERMTSFLSLIGLLALLVGGLGVAMTVHTYLQQKLDNIAVMKCLGARSAQIIRVYLVQGMVLGMIGSAIGVAGGYVIQLLFPRLLEGLIRIPTELEIAPGAALQGFLAGMVTTTLFLLPPLLAVRKIRPARVFLREMPETRYSTLQRLRRDPLPLISSALLLLGAGLLASWLGGSWSRGFGFLAGLAGAILILAAGARLLLFALGRLPRPSSLALRHGLKNLNRPGNHVTPVLVAIGVGVAFVLTVYLIQTSLLSQLVRAAPADYPNLFLIGITEEDKDEVWDFVRKAEGVLEFADPIPMIPARLQTIDGRSADEMELEPSGRRYFQTEFILSWSEDVPPEARVVEGRWWEKPSQEPLISVGSFSAGRLGIGVGSALEFTSSGVAVRGRVANIREMDFVRPGANNQFIFSPGALKGLPASYIGSVRVSPSQMPHLQKALFERFPGITSIDVGEVLVRVQNLLDRIAAIIRFIAFFAILAGVIILASSIAATRYQRIRETVLLKTLGATRAQVSRIQAAEFLIIGLAAGIIGCLLAAAAADYLLGSLLDTEFEFRWRPILAGTLAAAALVVATGWTTSRGVLRHRPLEVLREN